MRPVQPMGGNGGTWPICWGTAPNWDVIGQLRPGQTLTQASSRGAACSVSDFCLWPVGPLVAIWHHRMCRAACISRPAVLHFLVVSAISGALYPGGSLTGRISLWASDEGHPSLSAR